MKTEIPGVEWWLDCEPRLSQLEALARSYTGYAYRTSKHDPLPPEPVFALPHAGKPARGFPFFMEMRLGKTPTALNEFVSFKHDYGFKRMLVLSPSKYKYAWGSEAVRFGVTSYDLPVLVFESSDRGRKEARKFVSAGAGILVVNYEALIYENNVAVISEFVDDRTYIAADESVMLKNRESVFFKVGHELSKDAAITRPLTGKPVVQSAADLYSQLRFAKQLDGWNFYQFRGKFCEMGGFKGKKIVATKNEEGLREILNNVAFVAQRRDWGTWFETDQMIRKIEMTKEQTGNYREMETEFMTWLKDAGVEVSVDQVITKNMKLQQVSSGFIYDENRKPHWLMPHNKNPKLSMLKDDLENEISTKVIVVAIHKPVIDMLISELSAYNPAVIRGDKDFDVEAEKRRFNTDRACRVIIAQEKSVKYGHTLMGAPDDPCEYMAFFENSYSLDDRAQTVERPQGEGQQNPLTVIDYCVPGVETSCIEALQRKENVSQAILKYYERG